MHTKKRANTGATLTVKSATSGAEVAPEFGRFDTVERLYGLRRAPIYKLIHEGKIKSVLLREPGAKNGIRLIHLASVRAFLDGAMKTGGGIDPSLSARAANLRRGARQ